MQTDKMDTVSTVERRFGIIVGARLRDKSRIENAISTQDRLRKKSKGWRGMKEIRKWRDSR